MAAVAGAVPEYLAARAVRVRRPVLMRWAPVVAAAMAVQEARAVEEPAATGEPASEFTWWATPGPPLIPVVIFSWGYPEPEVPAASPETVWARPRMGKSGLL